MLRRVLFAVVGLSLLLGAIDMSASGAFATTTPGEAHASSLTSIREATIASPPSATTRVRRIVVVDGLFALSLATALGLYSLATARRLRTRRHQAGFAIRRRGPPALSVLS